MRISAQLSDDAILTELGQRLAQHRISLELTQKAVAEQAGIGTATLERMESGRSSSVTSLLRVLRVLGLMDGMERLVPPPTPSPMALLQAQGSPRKRASPKRRRDRERAPSGTPEPGEPRPDWTWGDER